MELFFTPKNKPSKVKNSKMGLHHTFGTQCRIASKEKDCQSQQTSLTGPNKGEKDIVFQNFFKV